MIRWKAVEGDCLDALKAIPDNSIDALCTDPPGGISFMGKKWDHDKGGRKQWIAYMAERFAECLRVMKPGAYGLVWAIPRTSHWTGTALEDAGFEVRDVVSHLFGSGFPKSHSVSMSIDKTLKKIGHRGAAFTTAGDGKGRGGQDMKGNKPGQLGQHEALSEEAQQWQGWGTALKPASEHWILVRKPLIGTVAKNILEHGVGALNIDATRIGTSGGLTKPTKSAGGKRDRWEGNQAFGKEAWEETGGRWPANVVLSHDADCKLVGSVEGPGYAINRFTDGAKPFGDGAGHPYESESVSETVERWACVPECPVRMLDSQTGILKSGDPTGSSRNEGGNLLAGRGKGVPLSGFGDSGGASRFFYCAKAPKREKNEGLDGENKHPTVKSLKLMRYLLKLISPPGAYVVDPFMGSGSTGVAAVGIGLNFLGMEQDVESLDTARVRIAHAWGKAHM